MKKLFSEINNIINNYEDNTVQLVDGLEYNQDETLKKIEFYWNSKYINGQKDDKNRVKPFYNIGKFRTNVAVRATDLDVKDIKVYSDNPDDRARSLILNKEIYNWMKEENFSKTLNEMGQARPKYGGVLVKKSTDDKGLHIDVVEWKNTITDPVDILNGVIIEKHWMSPSELSKKKGIWENVEEAIKLATKTRSKNGQEEATEKKVPIFEIHGEFQETLIPGVENGDETEYRRMLFIIAGDEEGKQVILWQEEEKEMPYKYLPWDKVAGRGLGVGIIEDGFEAQMWTNDAVLAEKRILDLAGKVFIKTTSQKFGNNVITDAEDGQVFVMEEGADAEVLNLLPASLPAFREVMDKWNSQYERSTNTFDAVTGETLPANTPLGSVAIQSQQASSFFDYRREEFGIFVTEIFMDWVLPFFIKKITKAHILASDYSNDELAMIDDAFATYKANEKVLKIIEQERRVPTKEEYAQMMAGVKEALAIDGSRRYVDVPNDFFKGYKAKITIDPTGEKKNKQEMLTSLFNVLTQMASNPALMQDPNLMQVFNQMLELSGIKFFPKPAPVMPQSAGGRVAMPQEPALTKQTESVLPEAQQ